MLAAKYQALLFDLDGTLVDSAPDLIAALNLMLDDFDLPQVPKAQAANFIGQGIEVLVARGIAGQDATPDNIVPDLFDVALRTFKAYYRETLGQHGKLYPDVVETLTALPQPKALVTNKARNFTEQLLAVYGLSEYFAVVICGDDLAQKKPAPEPLLACCERLQCAPHQSLMIGDSKSDLLAAKQAQMDAFIVSGGYHQGENLEAMQPRYFKPSLTHLLQDERKDQDE